MKLTLEDEMRWDEIWNMRWNMKYEIVDEIHVWDEIWEIIILNMWYRGGGRLMIFQNLFF